MTKPFAVTLPFEPVFPAAAELRLQRTRGEARIAFKHVGGGTRLDRLYQSGAAKIRLPNVATGDPPQAVLINSAGGLTGGDRLSVAVELADATRATITGQACEKIYRSASGDAVITTQLRIGRGARLDWLPQETILFDGGRLARRLEADVAPGATLLVVEATIFGRRARGETMTSGLFADRWRIRQAGRLVFAEDLRLDWARAAFLDGPAALGGNDAMATILLVAEEPERRLDAVRRIVGESGGASAWNGKLLARIVAEGGAALRRILLPALREFLDGAALPKLWLN